MLPTADISDKYSDSVRILKPLFRDYGGVKSFSGKVKTIKTLDDNTKVRAALESEGNGDVLVIDGQASLNCALLGGNLAALASQNNWSGIIVNGCIRDQLEIKEEKIGVKALNSNPKKSRRQYTKRNNNRRTKAQSLDNEKKSDSNQSKPTKDKKADIKT